MAGAVLLLALALWRLSQGPLSLDFLTSYIERSMVSADGSVRLNAKQTVLVWSGWGHTPEVRIATIEVIGAKGEVLATVPEASIKISIGALLSGEIAPAAIAIDRLKIGVVLVDQTQFEFALPDGEQNRSAAIIPILFDQLLAGSDANGALRRLERVTISNAELTVDDRRSGFVWRAPAAEAVLVRDREGVLIDATLDVMVGDHRSALNLRGLYSRDRARLAVAINFDNLRPSLFATADATLAGLKDFDLPMHGTIDIVASGRGELRSLVFNLAGSGGRIWVPRFYDVPKTVIAAALRGDIDFAQRQLRLDTLDLDFGDGISAQLQATIGREAGDWLVSGQGEIVNVPLARIGEFWPKSFAAGGRNWTLKNITGGKMVRAGGKFALRGPELDETLAVTDANATLEYTDLTVHFLRPLPPIVGLSGGAEFKAGEMIFAPHGGKLGDITLGDTSIKLTGFDTPNAQFAAIDVTINGPLQSVLKLLDDPKIGLPGDATFDRRRLGGAAAVRLQLRLPMIDALTMPMIEFAASANLRDVAGKEVLRGLDLTEGALTLQLNGKEMDVRGKARLGGLPVDISWQENFQRAAFRRRFDIKGQPDVADLAKFGIDPAGMISGKLGMHVVATEIDGRAGDAVVTFDIKQATAQIPQLFWRKPAGVDGTIKLTMPLKDAKGAPIQIALAGAGLDLRAKLLFAGPGDDLRQADIETLVVGRTSLSGTMVRQDGAGGIPIYALNLRGAAIDLAPYLADDSKGQKAARPAPTPPIYDVDIDVQGLLVRNGRLDATRGKIRVQGGKILSADVRGSYGAEGKLTVAIRPPDPANSAQRGRQLEVVVPDVGSLLASLGWLNGVSGGNLRLNAEFDDAKVDAPLIGQVRVGPYKLIKTPVVANVLSVTPLTDALAAFAGEGLSFDRLEGRFEVVNNSVQIRGLRTSGSSLGITAQGRVNTNENTLKMDGTIVPAYVLNSILSNIPLINIIVTGGPGGGIFAINYAIEGPLDNPRVSINPLSALAPGILRNLFGAGGGDEFDGEENRLEKQKEKEVR